MEWYPVNVEEHVIRHRVAKNYAALESMKSPAAVPALVAALKDDDKDICRSAAKALATIGQPAVSALLTAMSSAGAELCQIIVEIFGKIKDPITITPLIKILYDDNGGNIRDAAVNALSAIGHPGAPSLVTLLAHSNKNARLAAARALGMIGWKPKTPEEYLEFIFAKGDVNTVIDYKDPAVVMGLVGALKDADKDVCQASMNALKTFGSLALPALKDAMEDRDWHVREAAAEVLGTINDPTAVDLLLASLLVKEKNESVCRVAEEALVTIGKSAVPVLVRHLWDNATDYSARQIIVRILEKIKDAGAVHPLVWLLKNVEGTLLKLRIAFALMAINDDHGIEELFDYIITRNDSALSVVVDDMGKNRFIPEKIREMAKQARINAPLPLDAAERLKDFRNTI